MLYLRLRDGLVCSCLIRVGVAAMPGVCDFDRGSLVVAVMQPPQIHHYSKPTGHDP